MPRRARYQVGVIGLGIVGSRVAASLRQEGHQVFVWNRSVKREPCFLGSAREVAENAKILQVFVSDDDAVLGLIDLLGDSLGEGHVFICHATIGPETARQAAALVEKRGAAFLDAPFTGSKTGAEKRELVYYIGGDIAVLNKVRPILEVTSKNILHLGAIGDASVIKIATNIVTAAQIQAVTEALALTAASRVDPLKFKAALEMNAAYSGTLGVKLPAIIAQDFTPHFSLKHMFKDMQLAVRSGERVGLQLPIAEVTRSLLFEGLKEGWGELDFSSLAKHYFETPEPAARPVSKDEPKPDLVVAETPGVKPELPPATEPTPDKIESQKSDEASSLEKEAPVPADETPQGDVAVSAASVVLPPLPTLKPEPDAVSAKPAPIAPRGLSWFRRKKPTELQTPSLTLPVPTPGAVLAESASEGASSEEPQVEDSTPVENKPPEAESTTAKSL